MGPLFLRLADPPVAADITVLPDSTVSPLSTAVAPPATCTVDEVTAKVPEIPTFPLNLKGPPLSISTVGIVILAEVRG
jgi:hypothetical protein